VTIGALLSVLQRTSSVHLAERHLGMDLMDDSLLGRCHQLVDFHELLLQSPARGTDPNATAINVKSARLFAIKQRTELEVVLSTVAPHNPQREDLEAALAGLWRYRLRLAEQLQTITESVGQIGE